MTPDCSLFFWQDSMPTVREVGQGPWHLGLIMRLRGVVGGLQLIMSYVLPVLVAKR